MKFRVTLQCMSDSEIRAMIPPEKMAEIKKKDKKPLIKAFVVGHEGEARGNLIGVGNIVKRWFADMVSKLNDKIAIGLQLFHGHAATNDTAGRTPVAEVVGKTLKRIKDRLSSVVACWIYPEFKNLPFDVASIEADVELEGDPGKLYVADVNEISGIALSNSQVETPGFPGATLLGQLQAFAEERRKPQITLFKKGENEMTLAELKEAIQEAKFKPTDLFDPDAILADPFISEQVKEKISNARGYDIRKFEKLSEERAESEKKLREAEKRLGEQAEKLKAKELEMAKAQRGTLFEKQKDERKFDEKLTRYVQRRLERFDPKDAATIEKDFSAWLDAEVDEYGKIAKEVFDIKSEADGGEKGDKGSGPEKNETGDVESKYIDPSQNPMIRTNPE